MMKGVPMRSIAVGVVMLSFAAGAATRLELPMPGGFESLNAGVAAAVTMYEVLRQRG